MQIFKKGLDLVFSFQYSKIVSDGLFNIQTGVCPVSLNVKQGCGLDVWQIPRACTRHACGLFLPYYLMQIRISPFGTCKVYANSLILHYADKIRVWPVLLCKLGVVRNSVIRQICVYENWGVVYFYSMQIWVQPCLGWLIYVIFWYGTGGVAYFSLNMQIVPLPHFT